MCYGSSGYNGPKTYAELQAWHDKPRRKSNVIFSNNTTAERRESDGSFLVTLHYTDIVRVYPSGAVELTGLYNSQLTKTRYSAFFGHTHTHVYSEKIDGTHKLVFSVYTHRLYWEAREAAQAKAAKDGRELNQAEFDAELFETNPSLALKRFNWVVPASPGMRSDFEPTDAERILHLGARIGDADAARRLADMLSARGEHHMAHVTRSYAGVRYGHRGWFAELKQAFNDFYSSPSGTGAWIKKPGLDRSGRPNRLIRPLTRGEVEILGVDPNGADVTIDGVTYDIVDGATWTHFEKSAEYVLRYGAFKAAA